METWLDDTDGIISQRQSNLDDKQEKVTSSVDDLKTRYNTSYERYLEEFTSTLVEIESMKMSMAAFM